MAHCTAGTLDDGTPGHVVPRRHNDGCDDPATCPGCYLAQAVEGRVVCAWHEDRVNEALNALPDIWVDLAERPKIGESAPSRNERPAPTTGENISERSVIKSILVTWCRVLRDDFDIHLPEEAGIATSTLRIAAYHSEQSRQARDAASLLAMPAVGGLHPDPAGVANLKQTEKRHRDLADNARNNRETGRDIIRALCDHLRTQTARLLASPAHAPHYASDLTTAHNDGRRRANPSRVPITRIPCPACAAVSPIDIDENGEITCQHCRTKTHAREWRRFATDLPDPMNLEQLRVWLSKQGTTINLRRLRGWADRGDLHALPGESRNPDGTYADRLFEPLVSLYLVLRLLRREGPQDRRVA